MKPQEYIDNLTQQLSQQRQRLTAIRDEGVEQLRLLQDDLNLSEINPDWTAAELLELLIRLLGVKVDVSSGTIRIEEHIIAEDGCVATGADEAEDNDNIIKITEILNLMDSVVAPDTLDKIKETIALADATYTVLPNKLPVLMQELAKLLDKASAPHKHTNAETTKTSDSLKALTPAINRAIIVEKSTVIDNARIIDTKDIIGHTCSLLDATNVSSMSREEYINIYGEFTHEIKP